MHEETEEDAYHEDTNEGDGSEDEVVEVVHLCLIAMGHGGKCGKS